MPRPSKPIAMAKLKGHRTNSEIKSREKAEKALATEESFNEWDKIKNTPIAHNEFVRLKRLFCKIKKDDALLEGILNRYCLMLAECDEHEKLKEKLNEKMEELCKQDIDFVTKLTLEMKIQEKIMKCDTKIMQKRNMMLAIEKENIMTIASQLRSIPKKEVEEEESDPMAGFLKIVK